MNFKISKTSTPFVAERNVTRQEPKEKQIDISQSGSGDELGGGEAEGVSAGSAPRVARGPGVCGGECGAGRSGDG